jgi:hypothetical protein
MWRPLCAVVTLLLGALIAPKAVAQEPAPLAGIGSRVRLSFASPRTPQAVGRVVAIDSDSLVLEGKRATDRRALPRSIVHRVEVSLRRTSRTEPGIGLGALVGTLAAATTLYLGSSMANECGNGGAGWCSEVTTAGALQILGIGAATGALVGYLTTREPGDVWAATRWNEASASPRATSGTRLRVGFGRRDGRASLVLGWNLTW